MVQVDLTRLGCDINSSHTYAGSFHFGFSFAFDRVVHRIIGTIVGAIIVIVITSTTDNDWSSWSFLILQDQLFCQLDSHVSCCKLDVGRKIMV